MFGTGKADQEHHDADADPTALCHLVPRFGRLNLVIGTVFTELANIFVV